MQPWSAFGFLGTWASVPNRRLKRPVAVEEERREEGEEQHNEACAPPLDAYYRTLLHVPRISRPRAFSREDKRCRVENESGVKDVFRMASKCV